MVAIKHTTQQTGQNVSKIKIYEVPSTQIKERKEKDKRKIIALSIKGLNRLIDAANAST